jgi:hypothetical protein
MIRLYIFSLLVIIGLNSNAQTHAFNKSLKHFLDSIYNNNPNPLSYKHHIDTIIKLKNNHFFVLVKNENGGLSASESGTYDCYEINSFEKKISIINHVLNIGDNTGGMGICDVHYRLIYLNANDYIIVGLKNITHHGNYNLMSIILNSKVKYFDIDLTNDEYGFTSDYGFKKLIELKTTKNILTELNFKVITISNGRANTHIEEVKSYQIKAYDFNMKLGCITKISLLNTLKTVLK